MCVGGVRGIVVKIILGQMNIIIVVIPGSSNTLLRHGYGSLAKGQG